MAERVGSGKSWHLLSAVALRHAGFPLDVLEPLAELNARADAAALRPGGERATSWPWRCSCRQIFRAP